MRYNSKLLLAQLNLFFGDSSLDVFIDDYKSRKWQVFIDKDLIEIQTEKNIYHLGIIENCDKYFWNLSLSKKTYHQVEYSSLNGLFDYYYWFKVIEELENS